MKVSIAIPAIQPIETFLNYLKDRSNDPIHEANVDVIADFIDKFLVVEMKRLSSVKDVVNTTVEIPDEIVTGPLEQARNELALYKNALDAYLKATADAGEQVKKFLNGTSPVINTSVATATLKTATPLERVIAKARNGNGHEAKKKRDLTDGEKDTIRADFISVNGQFPEDASLPIFKKLQAASQARGDDDLSIFQITGFITKMHSYVASGELVLKNMSAYLTFLQGHRNLWATYNSEKYVALRAKVAANGGGVTV